MVMALSSLTKAEVLWSLNHHGPLEQWGSTKRSKKALQADKDATTSNARVRQNDALPGQSMNDVGLVKKGLNLQDTYLPSADGRWWS